jgi:hypothetical protein
MPWTSQAVDKKTAQFKGFLPAMNALPFCISNIACTRAFREKQQPRQVVFTAVFNLKTATRCETERWHDLLPFKNKKTAGQHLFGDADRLIKVILLKK